MLRKFLAPRVETSTSQIDQSRGDASPSRGVNLDGLGLENGSVRLGTKCIGLALAHASLFRRCSDPSVLH